MSIGFIGCGNMATAIIKGIIKSKTVEENEINVFDVYAPAVEKLTAEYKINKCESECDVYHRATPLFWLLSRMFCHRY